MSKKMIVLISCIALFFLVSGALAMPVSAFSSTNLHSQGINAYLTEVSSLPARDGDYGHYAATTPVNGSKFLYFFGTYTNNYSNTNDYAYYSWSNSEENNYLNYLVKDGDVISFSTFTAHAPGCGLEIEFTDGSHLRWNHYDYNGIKLQLANGGAQGRWYERRADISDMKGKRISAIGAVQENEAASGTYFECYFDSIRIISNPVKNPVCTDSDINWEYSSGLNPFIKGLTDNRIDGIGSALTDVCLSLDKIGTKSWKYNQVLAPYGCSGANCYVEEGYCNGNQVSNRMIACAKGCYDGACYR